MFWPNKSKQPTTTAVGACTEELAKVFLVNKGLTFKHANFSCKTGEIDLIMLEGNTIVFVEVKYRKSGHYGGAVSAVSPSKQQKIKKCAQFYLQHIGLNEYNTSCRFDVVTLDGALSQPDINWFQNAF